MSQNYSGRITLIVFVLFLALIAVFLPSVTQPKAVGFNPDIPFSQKTNLRPGIDIVGGSSLLYEIKPPEGTSSAQSATLAEQVTTALKRRIDPNGTLNLIWRPQNPNRLEIQMPLSGSSGTTNRLQMQVNDATATLEGLNVRLSDATAWVEQGPQRPAARLDELAKGSAKRKKILQDLAAAYDAIKSSDANPDPAERAALGTKARDDYARLQNELANTNFSVAELERTMMQKKDKQEARLKTLREQSAEYPARLNAINGYVDARHALDQSGGGLQSVADLKRMLRGSGLLEFHMLARDGDPRLTDDKHPAGFADWEKQLKESGPRWNPGDNYRWFEVDDPEEGRAGRMVAYDDRFFELASMRPEESLDKRSGDWKLADARPEVDHQTGQQVVRFEFDNLGGRLFSTLTSNPQNVSHPMAIMLDGKLVSAPNINTPITGGSGIISGNSSTGGFSSKELSYLVNMLSAGALPAQLAEEPIYERTVGPQLGEDNLQRGLVACGLGLIVVAVFLVSYYYLAGLVAFVGVLLNLVLILGAMAAIHATFTLPGIAAIVLTVGSAVDANVLIFERLREEQHRGLNIRRAVHNAYDRALSAIVDSNMTTLITSFFLIWFGTEEVKGFGITLIIGIIASLFTSLYVTKTIFGVLIDKFGLTKLGSLPLSIPAWDQMLRPNIRWTKLVLPFAGFSAVFIVAGLAIFGVYAARGQVMDIQFAGGTAVTFEITDAAVKSFKPGEEQASVRRWIDSASEKDPQALPAPAVVRVGTDNRTWEVTTASTDAPRVRAAIVSALGPNLKAELPSKFVGLNQPLDEIVKASGDSSIVLPITPDNLRDEAKAKWPGGVIPEEARRHVGGAAVFLRQLDPPISAKAITERINRQKLQVQPGQDSQSLSGEFVVVSPGGSDEVPTANAVILTSDRTIDYRKDAARWRDSVVAPVWSVAQLAVASPPQLQQVKNVDASVASDTQKDAVVALILSLVFIMAYVWFRFGNLKYGTATIIALLHDVVFCLAAIGFAHLLAGNFLGEVLRMQPFRINLELIAALLTVMGYSMLDTIVVFDRIRELRGKFGHVSPGVVNDAINQTLSRTILTAGTTVVSVGIMYFIGGEGIHGFTFVLFVGILAGTYSSIAIASPILLMGGSRREEGPSRAGRTASPAT